MHAVKGQRNAPFARIGKGDAQRICGPAIQPAKLYGFIDQLLRLHPVPRKLTATP